MIYHGCIEDADSCINCYVFKKGQVITGCGFSFDLDTFLYGQWLDEYNLNNLNDRYQIEGIEYRVIGELLADELRSVIDCFINSAVVKRKFKRWLTEY